MVFYKSLWSRNSEAANKYEKNNAKRRYVSIANDGFYIN